MNTVPCRVCKRQVARSAKVCPGCGVSQPASGLVAAGDQLGRIGCATMILLPFALILVVAVALCA